MPPSANGGCTLEGKRVRKLLCRILCWLTGGHKYDPQAVFLHYETMNACVWVRNHCVKCGKAYNAVIKLENIVGNHRAIDADRFM